MKNIYAIAKPILISLIVTVVFTGCQSKNTAVIFIPVVLKKVPENCIISGVQPKGIEISVVGTELAIKKLSGLKLHYPLDLSQASEGITSFQIKKELVRLPKNVSIVEINPTTLAVQVEKRAVKALFIEVLTSGEPQSDFIVTNIAVKPESVFVYGPSKIIESYKKIFTKPVDISGMTKSFKKEVVPDLPETISIRPDSGIFTAEINIEEKILDRKFENIKVKGKNTNLKYKISPQLASVTVKGTSGELERLTAENIEIYLDLIRLQPGTYRQRAVIILPADTTLIKAEPDIFTVTISK